MSTASISVTPALIGRDEQLALVRKCLAEAAAGAGSVVIVSGEAGLGKSRILEEAAGLAAERDFVVLRGAGIEREEKLPNGLFAGVLADFLRTADEEETRTVRGLLTELMPHLWSAVFADEPAPDEWLADMRPDMRQSLFLARLMALLAGRAQRQPVLLCLDDLHWADSASLQALQPLAQQARNAALTVLATLRPEEQPDEDTQTLPKTLLGLFRLEHFEQIGLTPLTMQQVRAVAVSCFRREALSTEMFELLHTRSGGVPLFLIQYLEFLLERGVIYQEHEVWINRGLDEGDIPESVRATIRRRIEQLREDERELLSLAAVQGAHFEGALVAKALAQPLTRTLRELAELGRRTRLVKSDGRGFRFSHAVLSEAFYQLLPESRRRHTHLRIAFILERDRPDDSEHLAYHFYRAELFDRALPHLIRAARQARDGFALREARLFLTQAHHACEACNGSTPEAMRFEALQLQAEVEHLLGEYDASLAVCRQVLEQAGPRQAMVARACLQMGQTYVRLADWAEAGRQYSRALELFGELGDSGRSARCYLGLGSMAFEQADLDAAQAHFTDARQTAIDSGDDSILGAILGNLGVVATVRGQYVEAVLHYTEALKAYSRAKNRFGFCQTYHNLGMCHANQGDPRSAIECYQKGEELAIDLGTVSVLADIRVSRAAAELRLGDLDGAERSCLQSAALMVQLGDPLGLAECRKVEGMVLRERGDLPESRRRLDEGLHAFREHGNELGVAECELELGVLESRRGDVGEARSRLSESVRLFRQIGAEDDVQRGEALLAEMA